MKILLFGASGAGSTSLGDALALRLGWPHLDADNYYWAKTNPPFQEKIPLTQRSTDLMGDLVAADSAIVSGSLVTWGSEWHAAFDLAVFLYVPAETRLARLRAREVDRYGAALRSNAAVRETSEAFLAWAARYDEAGFDGRSLAQHRGWMAELDCQVVELAGLQSVAERVEIVLGEMGGG